MFIDDKCVARSPSPLVARENSVPNAHRFIITFGGRRRRRRRRASILARGTMSIGRLTPDSRAILPSSVSRSHYVFAFHHGNADRSCGLRGKINNIVVKIEKPFFLSTATSAGEGGPRSEYFFSSVVSTRALSGDNARAENADAEVEEEPAAP